MTTITISETTVDVAAFGTAVTVTPSTSEVALSVAPGSTSFLGLSDTPDAYTAQGGKAVAVKSDVSGLEFVTFPSGAPSGAAGGVLSGTYPNPSFAVDMATQAELDSESSTRASADTTNAGNLTTHANLTTTAHGGIVPSARTLTINGTAFDLSANRSWTVSGGGSITGSGAAGQATFWDGSASITGSADYTWNDTSKVLKVRSGSGDAALTIDGASGHESDLNLLANGTLKWQFFRDSADAFGIFDAANGIVSYNINPSTKVTSIHNVSGIGYTFQLISTGRSLHRAKIANTNSAGYIDSFNVKSTGTPANGFGGALLWQLQSDSTDDRDAAEFEISWLDATDASRKGQYVFYVYDATTIRTPLKMATNGSAPTIGFLGATARARYSIASDATDLASVIALANDIKAGLLSFGLFS